MPPLGDYLGDLTDEEPINRILAFVTGGPKNYTYKLEKPTKENGSDSVCKVRGITLNFKNHLVVTHDTMRRMLEHYVSEKKVLTETVTDNYNICRDNVNKRLMTQLQNKKYRIVFDKRVVQDNYITYPYGY